MAKKWYISEIGICNVNRSYIVIMAKKRFLSEIGISNGNRSYIVVKGVEIKASSLR